MLWQGKPIEEHSKDELILIIESLTNNLRRQSERHVKELEELIGRVDAGKTQRVVIV